MNQLHLLQETANEAEKMLENNKEWITRYAGYASEITKNKEIIQKVRKSFREQKPLYVYSSISGAMKAKKEERVVFDLRYKGQSVANIKHDKKGLLLDTNENTGKFYGIEGGNTIEWKDKRAKLFLESFAEYPCRNNSGKKNEEHRFESALLTELSKKERLNKELLYIQPVHLFTSRFQMPTPFSASNKKKIEYKAHKGGGIDLLCRTKHGNKSILNIFELKDQYENPINVLRQAVIYSVFIHKLLRTPKAGSDIWWNLFKLRKGVNDKHPFRINAVAALPKDQRNDKSFERKEISIDGGIIQLHYFYFSLSKDDKVGDIKTSLFRKDTP